MEISFSLSRIVDLSSFPCQEQSAYAGQGYYEQGVKTDQQPVFEREWDGGRSHASLVLLLQRLERKQKIEGSKK